MVERQGGALLLPVDFGEPEGQLTLRFDANAIAEAEEVLGITSAAQWQAGLNMNIRTMRGLVFAALTAQQMYEEGHAYRAPRLTLYEVGHLLTNAPEDLGEQLVRTLGLSMPAPPPGGGGDDGADPLAETEGPEASPNISESAPSSPKMSSDSENASGT